jgi:two-component system, LuxR family, sensor histidine kinase TtrS
MSWRKAALLGLVTALSLGAALVHAQPKTEVRVGALAWLGADEAAAAWAPTLAQLNAALPAHRFTLVAGSQAFLTAAVAAHRLDFLITSPGHFLELKVDYSAAALATEQDLDGFSSSESVGAAIVVLDRRREVQQLTDLRGQKIAAVAPDAFGFRAVTAELLERGLDPLKDMSPVFTGFPADAVLAVLRSGRADAGVVRSCLLEKLIATGRAGADEFRVVGRKTAGKCKVSTRLYPGWAFVKVAQTPQNLADAVARELLAMQPGAGEKVWNAPDDYQSVQDLYRSLQVGPYAPFTRLGMAELLWRYRWPAAALVLAALWWVAHVIRVSQLVRRRTRELEEAYELARLKDVQMEHAMRLSLMGEMASSLAHEINQPLAAILSYARGCERRLDRGEDAQGLREAIGRIAVQAERAGDIVRRMRDFVRKNPARQAPLEPAGAFHEALALFEPTAAARGHVVEVEIPEKLPIVRADRVQLEEVILNLLQNALEAIADRPGGWIRFSAAQEGATVVAAVSDNGPGLTAEAREKLFEPFFTHKPGGLGLGLSLSRSIVEAHGGRLSADETSPPGATFRFYLPIMQETPQESAHV